MKGQKILVPLLVLLEAYSLGAIGIKQQISAIGATPVAFRIPIPTAGLSYEIVVQEHLILGVGLNASTALLPVNGLDGGSSHGSINASILLMFGSVGIGAKYFTQANSFFFSAFTDDSTRIKLGRINHTGRQDYIVLLLSIRITDRLTIFGGPGFEVVRNNNYRNSPESNVLQDSSLSDQWQAKISDYEAAYHNLLDRYKVYLGFSVRFLDL